MVTFRAVSTVVESHPARLAQNPNMLPLLLLVLRDVDSHASPLVRVALTIVVLQRPRGTSVGQIEFTRE